MRKLASNIFSLKFRDILLQSWKKRESEVKEREVSGEEYGEGRCAWICIAYSFSF